MCMRRVGGNFGDKWNDFAYASHAHWLGFFEHLLWLKQSRTAIWKAKALRSCFPSNVNLVDCEYLTPTAEVLWTVGQSSVVDSC